MFIALRHSDLIKRGPDRLDNFIDMVKEGKFILTKKGLVKLDSIQDIKQGKMNPEGLRELMLRSGFSSTFKGVTDGGKRIEIQYPKDFLKIPEFGGKGAGFGTAAEDRYLKKFQENLQEVLEKEKVPYINLKINGRVVQCANVISTPKGLTRRDPKADFIIVDINGNYVGFLSHKAGTKPTDFQQYGGLSDEAFSNNMEVKQFINDVILKYPNGLSSGVSVKRKIKNKEIILKSIYGIDYGKSPGVQNVDEFHQGYMTLQKMGKDYVINSTHKGVNGEQVKAFGYDPIYYARYTTDRGAKIGNLFLGKARVGVFASAKAAKTAEEI